MSKIKNGGLDHGMALNPSNSSNLEQLVLKRLTDHGITCTEATCHVLRVKRLARLNDNMHIPSCQTIKSSF